MRVLLAFLLFPCIVFGQYNPLERSNTFQSDNNPLYWKNKKPNASYWQQDVYYDIKAQLNDQADIIEGVLSLEYTNNSPNNLEVLVFHLYQNAFEPGSYASEFHNRAAKSDTNYQHIVVSDLTVNAQDVRFERDNTILTVRLNSELLPGEKAEIECAFKTYFGPQHGRMKMYETFGKKHYNVVHWYPRVSVYDAKFGWTKDQHLGHEFYGDFGAFDVELTLPANYVLDGTGFLLNRSEVLPDDLMDKLAIENFKDKPWNSPPSEILPESDELKTWKFHAENVHDFAWTADPHYRIGRQEVQLENGDKILCVALAQEQHASGWQNAAEYASQVVQVYSQDFGSYAYHKMIVADARDGMEYPMLTLDGGKDPSYRGLLAHEIGHNWFFGMVGNNETYRASLDEGFTQFLTSWALVKLEGDTMHRNDSGSKIDKLFYEAHGTVERSVYSGYYWSAIARDNSPSLNTHSDKFETRHQYGQVYSKTGTMLYNLQYVLGDELFLDAMSHYFNQWKFCHPYFGDFRRSIIQYTRVDLNWFFDQWLETEEKIDYKIKSVRKLGQDTLRIKLKRRGMQMPLDLRVYNELGTASDFHIPNTDFEKKTDATVLPKWYGWRNFKDTYTVDIPWKEEAGRVELDPSKRLADVYQLDNYSTLPLSVELNDFKWTSPHQEYEVEWNPIAWYNGYDGVKVGIEFKAHYYATYHKLHGKLMFNSSIAQQTGEFATEDLSEFNKISYFIEYVTPLRSIAQKLSIGLETSWIDGLFFNDVYVLKTLPNNKTSFKLGVASLYRASSTDLNYLMYPSLWDEESWNNFGRLITVHNYRYNKSNGRIQSELRAPLFWSDYSYGFLNVSAVNNNRFSKFNWRTRVFGQIGGGENWAPESQLYLAGANPEDMMQNPLTRSMGLTPQDFYGYGISTGNFQSGGGLGLRGYNNYLAPGLNSDSLFRYGYDGMSGVAFNTEFEFDDLVRIQGKWKRLVELKTYLFADAGIININRNDESLEWAKVRMDAGFGSTLEIKRWGKLNDWKPLKIRLDFPLFLNRVPAGEDYVQFRWLIGFDRAF